VKMLIGQNWLTISLKGEVCEYSGSVKQMNFFGQLDKQTLLCVGCENRTGREARDKACFFLMKARQPRT
jgi:hypothetical protein